MNRIKHSCKKLLLSNHMKILFRWNDIKYGVVLLTLASFVFSNHTYAQIFGWKIGNEKEVAPNVYVMLYGTYGKFNVWRKETKNGFECKAVAQYKRRTINYEHLAFWGPIIELSYKYEGIRATIKVGPTCNKEVQFKLPEKKFGMSLNDEKFLRDDGYSVNNNKVYHYLKNIEDKKIEISGHTYTYCNIFEGRSDYNVKAKLEGISAAGEAVKACQMGETMND